MVEMDGGCTAWPSCWRLNWNIDSIFHVHQNLKCVSPGTLFGMEKTYDGVKFSLLKVFMCLPFYRCIVSSLTHSILNATEKIFVCY